MPGRGPQYLALTEGVTHKNQQQRKSRSREGVAEGEKSSALLPVSRNLMTRRFSVSFLRPYFNLHINESLRCLLSRAAGGGRWLAAVSLWFGLCERALSLSVLIHCVN